VRSFIKRADLELAVGRAAGVVGDQKLGVVEAVGRDDARGGGQGARARLAFSRQQPSSFCKRIHENTPRSGTEILSLRSDWAPES
jgi:hypothetical protein